MSNLEDVFVSWSLECIVFQSKSESKSGCLCLVAQKDSISLKYRIYKEKRWQYPFHRSSPESILCLKKNTSYCKLPCWNEVQRNFGSIHIFLFDSWIYKKTFAIICSFSEQCSSEEPLHGNINATQYKIRMNNDKSNKFISDKILYPWTYVNGFIYIHIYIYYYNEEIWINKI